MTQMLVDLSNLVASVWGIVVAVSHLRLHLAVPLVVGRPGQDHLGRSQTEHAGVRPLTRKIALAKFTRTFGTLVSAGVPILSALDIVADTAGNEVVANAVKHARTAIKEGETIAKPLSESNVFPSMLVQMIAVGEETGALDTMLNKIADFYDEEVSVATDGLTSLIEPLMMASLGVIVGGMVIALYLPMFQVISLVK